MGDRRGFTLVEIMVALVILCVVILGFASTTGRFLNQVTTSTQQANAIQLAEDRIEMIRIDPNYGGLDTLYGKTETTFPTLPDFARNTTVVRTGGPGQPNDYKTITVTVTAPGLLPPVSRTVTVAAP